MKIWKIFAMICAISLLTTGCNFTKSAKSENTTAVSDKPGTHKTFSKKDVKTATERLKHLSKEEAEKDIEETQRKTKSMSQAELAKVEAESAEVLSNLSDAEFDELVKAAAKAYDLDEKIVRDALTHAKAKK